VAPATLSCRFPPDVQPGFIMPYPVPDFHVQDLDMLLRAWPYHHHGPSRRCQECRCWLRLGNLEKECAPCYEKKRAAPNMKKTDRVVTEQVVQTYWNKVERNGTACWGWKGHVNTQGSAVFYGSGGQLYYARRVSYEIHHRQSPPAFVFRLCSTPGCTNPAHMQLSAAGFRGKKK